MAQSVRDLPDEIQSMVEIREWDMRNPKALDLFKKSKVKKLPSIAIAGELKYESMIPDQDELIETIRQCFKGG